MFDYSQWRTQSAGRVNADGSIDAVFGCSVTKPGNGQYRIKLFDSTLPGVPAGAGLPVPANRLLCFVTPVGGTPKIVSVDDVNDNEKDIFIATNAGTLEDTEFTFNVGYFLPAG